MANFNDLVRVYDNDKKRCSRIVRYIAFENGQHRVTNNTILLPEPVGKWLAGDLVNNAEVVYPVSVQEYTLYLSEHEILELKAQLEDIVPF